MGKKYVNLNITRDGPVMGSTLEKLLNQFAGSFIPLIEFQAEAIETLHGQVKALRHDLETERRLRLGKGGRK